MISATAVEFYSAIRKDPAVIAYLGEAETEETLIERIKSEGAKRGFALSDADIRQGFDHLDTVVHQAAGDDELTEKELEIVSGGTTFSAFTPCETSRETKGKKWGFYETYGDGRTAYFNSAGCITDKDTFRKMNT